jgi:hypothetical protein
MHSITTSNVNTAFSAGLQWLRVAGELEESRNGPVLVSPTPVCTTYKFPTQRVLFCPERNANPFFHLMEALWMMAGREDLAFPAYYNSGMTKYSDDGFTLNGAYGYRWRKHFGFDQILEVVRHLNNDPNSRRAVMTMYDGQFDTMENPGSKDIPCNTQIYFDCRGDKLNMTVCCRSNDAIWGAYGANAVHMSVLQEVMAAGLDIPVGVYRQMSNNFHIYPEVHDLQKLVWADSPNPYRTEGYVPYPLVNQHSDMFEWLAECEQFCRQPSEEPNFNNTFFADVAYPVHMAWTERKEGISSGMQWATMIEADDWRVACCDWIRRKGSQYD